MSYSPFDPVCPNTDSGKHYWVLIRTRIVRRKAYRFYECVNCNIPVLTIDETLENDDGTQHH